MSAVCPGRTPDERIPDVAHHDDRCSEQRYPGESEARWGRSSRPSSTLSAKSPGELIPLWEIAGDHGYDITKRNTMHSWRRAAHNLYQLGLIEEEWVWTSGYHTQVLCMSTPDYHTDAEDAAVRQRVRHGAQEP